jgi:hypothetical protein
MAHIRKTIRENIVTTLTGLSTTGSSVYETRIFPINYAKLPALMVYTQDDNVVEYTITSSSRTQHRQLTCIIEGHIKATANIDDTIDTISEEVEEAMSTDRTRGGNAKDTRLQTTEIEFEEATQKVGLVRFTYIVDYVTIENAVQTGV